ncbi:SLATT domain-containing protein [Spirillospora sp. NPDC049024]
MLHLEIATELQRIERARRRNKRLAFGLRLLPVLTSALTTVLLGLSTSGAASHSLAPMALILSAGGTVALAVDAFYNHLGLWAMDVSHLARLQALDRRIRDEQARAAQDSLPDDIVDTLRQGFEEIMEAHLQTWHSVRAQAVNPPQLPSASGNTPPSPPAGASPVGQS